MLSLSLHIYTHTQREKLLTDVSLKTCPQLGQLVQLVLEFLRVLPGKTNVVHVDLSYLGFGPIPEGKKKDNKHHAKDVEEDHQLAWKSC